MAVQCLQGAYGEPAFEELDEIFSLSDRVAVIFQGSLMDTFEVYEAELSQIGLLMGGSVKNAR